MNKNFLLFIVFFSIIFCIFIPFLIFKFILTKNENKIIKIEDENLNKRIKYNFGKSQKINQEEKLFLKQINWNAVEEVHGLKLIIKPMDVSSVDTIYTKEDFFQPPSLFNNESEKIEFAKKDELRKKIDTNHLKVIKILKNTSNKVIYFCYCSRREGFSYGLYSVSNWQEPYLHEPIYPSIYIPRTYVTEDVIKIFPGQSYTHIYDLKYYFFKKGNIYSIYSEYIFTPPNLDSKKFFPSINGKIVGSKPITLPIWEGKLKSNTLTVVVR